MKLTVLTLCCLIVFLQYKIWFDNGNVGDVKQIREELILTQTALEEQLARNESLYVKIDAVKHSEQLLESYARKELGLKKANEDYYQIVED